MAEKVPSDFEWVHARAACSPSKVFEQLRLQIAQDVKLRNKLCESQGYKFGISEESAAFSVFLDSVNHRETPHRVIRFCLDDQRIIARYGDETHIFTATLTLNEDGECRLRINDKNYDLWQARQMALEKLFFEIVRV